MRKLWLVTLCGVLALLVIGMSYGSRSSALENEDFRITGTINGQSIDDALNPATAIKIDLAAPITFDISFEILSTSNITIDDLGITIRIFGFDVFTVTLPVGQTIASGSSAQFNDTVDFGQFLNIGDGFSILGGTYDIGVAAHYTIEDTGEQKAVARDVYLNIDAPIYASITGLTSLLSLGMVGGKTLISRPKTTMGATTFGASSTGSGYFVGQQMGWLSFDLTSMILTVVGVCMACGILGYLILRRRKKGPECIVQSGTTYCQKDASAPLNKSQPRVPSKVVELNIDHITDFITYKKEKGNR